MGGENLIEIFSPWLRESTKKWVVLTLTLVNVIGLVFLSVMLFLWILKIVNQPTPLEKSEAAALRLPGLPEIQENNIESQKKMAGLSQPDYQSIKLVARIAGMNSFIEVGEPTRVEDGYFLKIRVPGYDGCGVKVFKETAQVDRSPGWVASGVACSTQIFPPRKNPAMAK